MTETLVAPRPASPPATTADSCEVRIAGPGDQRFRLRRNDLLLKAAIDQGLDYPHNCRVGVCGRCKTRLVSGRITPMVDLALSPLTNQDLREGYFLACQAKVRGDIEVEVRLGTHRQLPTVSIPGRVVRCEQLPGEVMDLRLRLEQPLHFEAGQYATLAESGSFVRRSYSFYDPPPGPEGTLEVGFLVKRLPGGRFSEWLFNGNRLGTRFWLEGPFGVMAVDEPDRDALCVAGGTGLSPMLSIIEARLRASSAARMTLILGVRSQMDRFYEPYVEALKSRAGGRLDVQIWLSHEPADSGYRGPRGLVTEALAPALGLPFHELLGFACGNLGMVEAVERRLIALGVQPDRIHADKFIPSGV